MIDNIFIEKAYVISIEGSPSYKEWSTRDYVEIFPGANTVALFHSLKNKTKEEWHEAIKNKYSFLVKPVAKASSYLFSNQGSIGCTISHCLLLEKISKQKHGWYLIIEDDVKPKDVRKVMRGYIPAGMQKYPKPGQRYQEASFEYTESPLRDTNLINLNSRADDGCEAYLIHSSVTVPILKFVNKTVTRAADKILFRDVVRGVPEVTYLHDKDKITLNGKTPTRHYFKS